MSKLLDAKLDELFVMSPVHSTPDFKVLWMKTDIEVNGEKIITILTLDKLKTIVKELVSTAKKEGMNFERSRHVVEVGMIRQENQEMKNAINTLIGYSDIDKAIKDDA